MNDYAEIEARILEKIGKRLFKLDEALDKLETTESKIKQFYEQEKALHEVKSILRQEAKLDELYKKAVLGVLDESTDRTEKEYEDDAREAAHEYSLLSGIARQLNKLDKSLFKLNETDSKAKGFIEQRKVIHYINGICHKEAALGI